MSFSFLEISVRKVNLRFKYQAIVIYYSLQISKKYDITQWIQAFTLLGMGIKIKKVGHILQCFII